MIPRGVGFDTQDIPLHRVGHFRCGFRKWY